MGSGNGIAHVDKAALGHLLAVAVFVLRKMQVFHGLVGQAGIIERRAHRIRHSGQGLFLCRLGSGDFRLLFHWVYRCILAGLGLPEGGEHLIRKLVVIHGDELIAGQKRFRGQPLFSGLGLVELLCQQMAFLPDPCGFVPAPEAPTGIGVANIVAVLADDIFAHTLTSVPFRRSSISVCTSLFMGWMLLPFQP